jgi:hypothetical protein
MARTSYIWKGSLGRDTRPASGMYTLTTFQGTLPFISRRILVAWSLDQPTLHTAIDDLESFAWVVLWAALHKSRKTLIKETNWLWTLSGDDIHTVANAKYAIMRDKFDHKYFSEDVQPLLPLLVGWFSLAKAAETELDEFIQEHLPSSGDGEDFQIARKTSQKLEELCLDYYVRYLQKAVNFLATFR